MAKYVDIALSDLLLDVRNARLRETRSSQQAALLALAEQQKMRLLKLARDIVDHGLDPTTIPVVVPAPERDGRYIVIEGNRRVVALKALETPSVVAPAFGTVAQARLNKLHEDFSENPVTSLMCVLFETESDPEHWVRLRHTGENEGIGLVRWGAEEQERYAKRHGQPSADSSAGQVLEFVQKHGGLSEEAQTSNKGIITSVRRLLGTPEVRKILGVEVSKGKVTTLYPGSEVAKSLTRVVDDLKTERIKVGDIYQSQQRIDYAKKIADSDLPAPSSRLDSPIPLEEVDDVSVQDDTESASKPTQRPRSRKDKLRPTLIPKDVNLNIGQTRIHNIYVELRNLKIEEFPNAVSVCIRVFVEASVDHYLDQNSVAVNSRSKGPSLAQRIRTVADDLKKKGRINEDQRLLVYRMAKDHYSLAAGAQTFNQYVHNPHFHPKASELRSAWDELQTFIEKLWP